MILEILIIILFGMITFLIWNGNKKSIKLENNPLETQQLCGMSRVMDDNKLKYIHSGCTIDRAATFDDSMPGESPFGDDGFEWEHENALLGNGYEFGNL